uniref:Ciliary microtubule inner protein 7 n=1 Tax=Podarcis muralis TaxID=64176 RepID=A0A670K2S8_PODMU
VAKSLVGSWPHANGFYGNYRSRCRSDFTQEYRKAAQPQPPELFLKRMKETPSKHIFSKHDNRHAFPGSGLGRRRIEGSLPNTKNLIDWVPLKEELRRERPLISSYQYDFHSREKVPQVLVHHSHRQGQPLQRTPSTTYQHTYRRGDLRGKWETGTVIPGNCAMEAGPALRLLCVLCCFLE